MSSERCTPAPGSKEAIKRHCKCAVLDNDHGRGGRGGGAIFVINGNCPLHGESSDYLVEDGD